MNVADLILEQKNYNDAFKCYKITTVPCKKTTHLSRAFSRTQHVHLSMNYKTLVTVILT